MGIKEKYPLKLDVDDARLADISDDDSVSLVYRIGGIFQLFNLKTGEASTSLTKPNVGAFTCLLSPDTRSLASAANSTLSRWDFGSSHLTWHSSDAKPPKNVRPNPKWTVELKLGVSIQSNGTQPRVICSIPLEHSPGGYEWIEDDRKLKIFSRYGHRYTDIEWDPPEAIEEPILRFVRLVIGQKFDENRKMVPIPDKERVKLREELKTAKVKDPRWRKLLDWWNEGRPGD